MCLVFIGPDFFKRDVLEVARDLIGVELIWDGCSGRIVETEAYAVAGDPACHTASRPSARQFVSEQPPGAAYVYFNYGMFWLFNLHVRYGPRDGLILIRALEPLRGIERMRQRRGREKLEDLCSGPGKLAVALDIRREDHGALLCGKGRRSGCGLKLPATTSGEVLADIRVGISSAADFPWRFVLAGSPHLSVPHGRVKPFQQKTKRARP